MTTDTVNICVIARGELKKNSNRLLVAMCIGIALALYGCYVSTRSQSNPHYMPQTSMAVHWLNGKFGKILDNPIKMLKNCNNKHSKQTHTHSKLHSHNLINYVLHGFANHSGIINGIINLVQIMILKMYCSSIQATDVILGLSTFGLLVSLLCIIGSFASCKLMCLSCLGIHHAFIIYFVVCRRKILTNALCPIQTQTTCAFGSSTNYGNSRVDPKSSSSKNSLSVRRRTTVNK